MSWIDKSEIPDILAAMDLLETFKALPNRVRLEILKGLKDPAKSFPPWDENDVDTVGVCVNSIRGDVGPLQSTVSDYLAILRRVGLVEVRRIGQWTHHKRNEANTRALVELTGAELQFSLRHNISKIPDIPLY